MSARLLQQIFKNVYGKPSWLVRYNPGAGVTFEFGKPKLNIWKKVLQPTKKGRKYPRRVATVHGDWHLCTFCCDWEIRQNQRKICDSNSERAEINHGCAILDGQMLTKVVVNSKNLVTDFHFDLGGHLQTRPYKKEDEFSSMWDLFCPNGRVFSLRSDGNYSYQPGGKPVPEKCWQSFIN
jgi:hypothetical protein